MKLNRYLISFPLIVLFFFIFPARALATDYYVSNSGSDSNAGTSENSAWKTITKVNSSTFSPGDKIFFERGGSWSGALDAKLNGMQSSLITIAAYGSASNLPQLENITLNYDEYIKVENVLVDAGGLYDFAVNIYEGKYITVYNCVVRNAKRANIFAGPITGLTVKNVDSYGSKKEHGIYIAAEPEGSIHVAQNIVIEDSEFHDNYRNGIQFNSGGYDTVKNPVVRRNLLYNNGQSGINDIASENAQIYNNIFYNNVNRQIRPVPEPDSIAEVFFGYDTGEDENGNYACRNAQFFHNTIYNISGEAVYAISFADKAKNIKVKNNIINLKAEKTIIDFDEENSFDIDYNLYGLDGMFSYKGNWYDNFSDWQAVSGKDQHSLLANPQFVNPGSFDFHLQVSSPAIDAGVGLGVNEDFEGNPRPQGNGFDIGAYEYQTVQSSPSPSPSPTPNPACLADLNGNQVVDLPDIDLIRSLWKQPCSSCPEDLNQDGQINLADIAYILTSWGQSCE